MVFYSVHFNRPEFIEIQKKCIDEIGGTLVVINNSGDARISSECEKMEVNCYSNPRVENSSPSHSHGSALNYITEIIDHSRDWCTLDHDFFPLREIKFEDYDILGLVHGDERVGNYLWPGFMAGKKSIPLSGINFLPSPGKDTGSGTSVLLNRGYKIREITEEKIGFDDSNSPLQKQSGLIRFENFGVHYLNGSEWMSVDSSTRDKKRNFLLETIFQMLNKNKE